MAAWGCLAACLPTYLPTWLHILWAGEAMLLCSDDHGVVPCCS